MTKKDFSFSPEIRSSSSANFLKHHHTLVSTQV